MQSAFHQMRGDIVMIFIVVEYVILNKHCI